MRDETVSIDGYHAAEPWNRAQVTLEVAGEIDVATAQQLCHAVNECLSRRPRRAVLDE